MKDESTDDELQDLKFRLSRLDSRVLNGASTFRTLEVLKYYPGTCAGKIRDLVGQAKQHLKMNARNLKTLGLTESLGTGFCLAPRGETLLQILCSEAIGVTPRHQDSPAGTDEFRFFI